MKYEVEVTKRLFVDFKDKKKADKGMKYSNVSFDDFMGFLTDEFISDEEFIDENTGEFYRRVLGIGFFTRIETEGMGKDLYTNALDTEAVNLFGEIEISVIHGFEHEVNEDDIED